MNKKEKLAFLDFTINKDLTPTYEGETVCFYICNEFKNYMNRPVFETEEMEEGYMIDEFPELHELIMTKGQEIVDNAAYYFSDKYHWGSPWNIHGITNNKHEARREILKQFKEQLLKQ